MYVSCETDDDLAYVIKYAGENNLVIGTDYGHNDQSTEIDALRNLKDNGGLGADQYRKIVDDNARALWGL
jgi:predicted TIM-barrel fold metal-dependent hydrolase